MRADSSRTVRILFVSQLLPMPLDAGPKIRAHYVLRHLADAGHEVTLLCWVRPGDRDEDVESLGRFCRSVITLPLARSRWNDVRHGLLSVASREPFLIRRDRSRSMADLLHRVTQQRSYDALHADQLWMAPFVDRNAAVGFKVLDQHNAVFRIPERMADCSRNPAARLLLRAEARKLEAFERGLVDRFTRVVWVSRQDCDAVCAPAKARQDRDDVIPIAVDPAATSPVRRRQPFRVTFVGGLHWPPNAEGVQWFVSSVWPLVVRAVPEAVLTIIGRGSARAIGRARGVEIAGYVKDPTPYFEDTAAMIVPLRSGAGMRVKILDAWCRALPVVSTSIGAEGIVVADGENIVIADEPADFAAALVEVLRDRVLADRIAANGRTTVESHYDWRKTYQAWDRVYR